MPNFCFNRVKLMGDEEKLHNAWIKLKDCLDKKIYALSEVAEELEIDISEDIYCRGSIHYIDRSDDGSLFLDVETAWEPVNDFWDVFTEKMDLKYASLSEECGMEIYVIHNDLDAIHFPENYLLDIWEKYQGLTDDYYYFETEKELCTYMSEVIANHQFTSFEEVKDFIDDMDIGSAHQYSRD